MQPDFVDSSRAPTENADTQAMACACLHLTARARAGTTRGGAGPGVVAARPALQSYGCGVVGSSRGPHRRRARGDRRSAVENQRSFRRRWREGSQRSLSDGQTAASWARRADSYSVGTDPQGARSSGPPLRLFLQLGRLVVSLPGFLDTGWTAPASCRSRHSCD